MSQAVLKLQGQQGQPNSETTKSMKVAIINGTHLCLLPPPKYHQQQQQDESKNKDGKTNNEAITQLKVPAISLRFIPNILNCKTQINVNENEMDILEKEEFASSSEIATTAASVTSVTSIAPTITSNNHTASRNIFTNNGLLMWKDYIIDQQTMQQCFENGHASSFTPRIELQLHCPQGGTSFDSYNSNLTNNCSGRGSESGNGNGNGKSNDSVGDSYYRENTSRKRQRSQNVHPTLTVAHVNANGGIFIRNNNNGYSNNRKYNNNINHYSYTLMQKDEENQLLQIDNQNAGYIIADFFGYNALEQILFLPPMSSLSLINKSTDIINGNRNQGEFENNHQKQYLIELIRHSIITNGRDVFYFKFDKQPFLLSNSTYKNSSNSSNDGDNNEINNTMIINDVPIFVRMDTNDYIGKNNMMISTIMLPLFQGKLPALHTNNDNELLDVNNTCKKRKRNQQAHDVNQKKNSPNIGSLKHNTTKKIARGDEEDDCSYDKDNNNDDNNVNESNNATNQTNSTANHWKYKIKSGLQQRLKYELKKKMKQRNIQLIQQRVLQQNRIILQRLSLRGLSGLKSSSISSPNANTPTPTTKKKRNDVCMNKSILDDTAILEMMHIRHKVQTIDGMASTTSTTSTHHQNSLSVKIHFSIDIWFHEKNRDNGTFSESTTATSTTKSKSKSINDHSNVNHLHNVQLSSSFNSVQGQSNVIVKTHSAVVPWLCLGECVTILATVYVSGIQLINGLSTPISLTLNAFWENYHHDHQNTGNAVDTNIGSIEKGDKVFDSNILNMKGIALGSFDIPVESILLDQQISNVANSEQDCGMTNFKKFYPVMDGGGYSASNNDRAIVSNAIYEYRRPRIVLIDVSNNVSADVIDEWKIQMTSINRRLSNGSYIDVYHDKERMQIKATALAESPELRSSIVELILKYLPENAQIVDSLVEPIKERSLVASILDAAKKEVQLIESHSTMTNKLSMTELCQIVGAQSKTDELAARLIMLQKQKK